jgi:hypothetical protein
MTQSRAEPKQAAQELLGLPLAPEVAPVDDEQVLIISSRPTSGASGSANSSYAARFDSGCVSLRCSIAAAVQR